MTSVESSTLIYINDISTGTATGQASNIDAVGFYYFDGSASKWTKLNIGGVTADFTPDAFIDDSANSMVKLGANSSGGSRAPGSDFVIKDNGRVGIGTASPSQLLDVNGKARVRNLSTLTSSNVSPVYSDENGVLGKVAISLQSQIAFYRSDVAYSFPASSFNAGNKQIIPIQSSHASLNTIGTTVDTSGVVSIAQTGTYLLGGSINFQLNMDDNDSYAYIAINLELSTDNGLTWSSISGGRPLFPRVVTNAVRNYPFVIPSVISQLTSGNKIRISVYRSKTDNNTVQGTSMAAIGIGLSYGAPAYTFSFTKL
ncbi:hypothetical protein [Chryseobacterium cucumeris]|uniref:hypothetical protein n=1 Tax=Chryseobacterium cucumeris TaxID=1813611 RepID=UPI001F4AD1B9|nr:hypothetical protein [Chryseobacterium cucumeris]